MASNGKNSITLRITGPDGRTHVSVSELDSVILGSGAGAGIRIPDPKVSNLHVMLKVEKGGVVKAIDLGSEEGTRVGERPIDGPTPLSSGDVIRLGASRVEVLFGTPQDAAVNPGSPAELPAPAVAPRGLARTGPARTGATTGTSHTPVRGSAAAARALAPEESLPLHTLATGESAPRPGNRVLQVAMVWGDTIVGLQHYGDGVPVTIGEAKRSEFHIDSPGVGQSFTLVRARGDKALIRVPEGSAVTLFSGARQLGLDEMRAEGRLRAEAGGPGTFELALGERAKVTLGTLCFLVRFVAPSPVVPVKRLEGDELSFFMLAALLLLLGAGVVATFLLMPKSTGLSDAEILEHRAAVVKLLLKPKPPEVAKPRRKLEEKSGAEEGAKAQGEEGAFGKPEAKAPEADPSKPGSPVVDPNKRERDRRKVMSLGLLGALGGTGGGASDVFGPGGLGTGINEKLGGLKGGAGLTDRRGVGGLGSRGTGTGGGGTGLGLGGLGTKGTGRGSGGHGIELGGRGHETTRVIPGKTIVVGGLSKEVIAKVIRDHQREIKYCYEAELNKTPDLAGKVAAMFVIGPDGTVQEASVAETTLNNSAAEQCMLTRIRRWRFPEPQGGGVVTVTFPWIFKPAGTEG